MPPPPQPQQTPQPALPPRERPAPEASPVPTPPTAPKPAHEARPATDGRVIQFEWLVNEPDDSPLVPVPPDLAEILGPEDAQAFAAFCETGFTSSAGWWSVGLPMCTKFALAENAVMRKHLREQREELHRERREWIEHMSRKTEALQYDYSVRRADFVEQQEIDAAVEQELRTQLRESQAREEALKAAIALLRPS